MHPVQLHSLLLFLSVRGLLQVNAYAYQPLICGPLEGSLNIWKKPARTPLPTSKKNETGKERRRVNHFKFVLLCNREQGNFTQDDACYSHTPAPRVIRFLNFEKPCTRVCWYLNSPFHLWILCQRDDILKQVYVCQKAQRLIWQKPPCSSVAERGFLMLATKMPSFFKEDLIVFCLLFDHSVKLSSLCRLDSWRNCSSLPTLTKKSISLPSACL